MGVRGEGRGDYVRVCVNKKNKKREGRWSHHDSIDTKTRQRERESDTTTRTYSPIPRRADAGDDGDKHRPEQATNEPERDTEEEV